jgi:TRAP-type transport system small permease protein
MKKLADLVDRYISWALVIALLFMFMLIFLNVVLRFVFSTGVSIAEELARFAFVWTTFLGAYLAVRENRHIGISGLVGYVSKQHMWILKLVINAIETLILAVVLVGAWEIFLANMGGRAPVSGAPVAIAFSAVVVGAGAMLIIFAVRALTLLVTRRVEDET